MTTTGGFKEGGIPDECIENLDELPSSLVENLECCICSLIVKDPVECSICESLYCQDCFKQLEISGKGCVMRCSNSKIGKANKFIYDILERLKLKCPYCNIGGLDYTMFILHTNVCELAQRYGKLDQLKKALSDNDEEIISLQKKIEDVEAGNYVDNDSDVPQDVLRKEMLTNSLSVNQKMELYQAAYEGRLLDFQRLIEEKKYSIFEEVSAKNFYWTPLHYAMHYGKTEIAFYILEYLKKNGTYDRAMKLESNDGRNPILCLLKSNALNAAEKKNCFIRLCERYKIKPNPATLKEIKNRNLDEIFKENVKKFK